MTRAAQLAGAGAVLCGVAAAFAAPELYVPGLSLVLVAMVAPAWVTLAAAGTRVELRCPRDVVSEGERVTLEIRMSRGPWPLPGATLELQGGEPIAIPRRRAGGRTAASVIPRRRGRRRIGPLRLTLRDPLGVCHREVASEAVELLVLPSVHPVSARAGGGPAGDTGRSAHAPRPADEIDSLRPYRPGAPASRIHWPTVARTGELVEHRLGAEADQRPLVAVDARRPESDEALDRALRAAASLCVHLARRGGCDLLLPGDRRAAPIAADLRGWASQHARLALVGPEGAGPSWPRSTFASNLICVTAAPPGTADVPPGSWRVAPQPIARLPVAFSVAGCAAQLVPSAAGIGSA